jgi:hypothetical protein
MSRSSLSQFSKITAAAAAMFLARTAHRFAGFKESVLILIVRANPGASRNLLDQVVHVLRRLLPAAQ